MSKQRIFTEVINPVGATFVPTPPFGLRVAKRGVRGDGIRYEKKAIAYLEKRYAGRCIPGPWIRFYDPVVRWCQPDFLIIDPWKGEITIIEIKLRHCPEAFWQMRKLYQPVLRSMFPAHLWKIKCCEVTKWFDPQVRWPEPPLMREHPHDCPIDRVGVHIYNREF